MLPRVTIGTRVIDEAHPPMLIAEAGINHDGDVQKAIELIDAAAEAGADCIKFQCHIAEAEMIPTDARLGTLSKERVWDLMKRCGLTEEQEQRLKAYCEQKQIMYLCTPFSREAADRLERLDVLAYKIGSGECNNVPLIEHVAKKGKPMIVSTGMNDIASIRRSMEAIWRYQVPVILMHCTSMYPTPYEEVRLGAIRELQETFRVPVGLSDHSLGIYTCLGAVPLGACVLEKHFTVSRQWPGPDIAISIEPQELAELVKGARAVHAARKGSKAILPQERPVIEFAYASVVSLRDIQAGETLNLDNTWVKRPGTGIPAARLQEILGREARRPIAADRLVSFDDLTP